MPAATDVVLCLADHRWSCYYDRAQHLMTQCAREHPTIFVEEPEIDTTAPDVELSETRSGVTTLIPHLPPGLTFQQIEQAQRRAIDFVLAYLDCRAPVLWYYAPKALAYTDHVPARAIVYDWVEDGSTARRGHRTQQLLDCATVIFTDGLPDHRQWLHHDVHAFTGEPSWEATWHAMWSHVESVVVQSQVPQSISISR